MNIKELIDELNDLYLIYGDKVIVTVTDNKNDYWVTSVSGRQCAKYFKPEDQVSEAIISIRKREG